MSDIHDLVGAYAVDALDPAERDLFQAHLAQCPDCAAELGGYREVLAALADAHAVTPPPEVAEAVVGRAVGRGTARGPHAGAAGPAGSAVTAPMDGTGSDLPAQAGPPSAAEPIAEPGQPRDPHPAPAGGESGDPVVVPLARRRRAPSAWLGMAAAAASLFLGGVLVGRQTSPGVPVAGDEAMSAVLEVAAAGDAHFLPVDMMGARSRVVMSSEMGRSAFLATDLPTPAKGQCYQVWRVDADGSKESAGLFVPDADGHVAVVLAGGADVSSYVITLEPPGGSKAPTGEMVGHVDT